MTILSLVKNLSLATVGALATNLVAFQQVSASPLINGDFETGDLTGWTTFTTPNGTLGEGFPNVVSFDTDNDGISSNSAQFRVGKINFVNNEYEGGGIFQNVNLSAGDLTISADIASFGGEIFNNASGGKFELLFDNVVLDTYDFLGIDANVGEFSFLSSLSNITAGLHEIRFLVTRPFLQGPTPTQYDDTPTQYIDDIVISGTATKSIPEPTLILGLLAIGAVSVSSVRKRQ
ncbi:PEP-CTERM sorting domain-containing protein [Nostoc sp. WHI]|uniref:PEP-CTERM sorting domain-containing protein n=1 Tax=Nostoc sp. WHI TaxID=2650611 RepID=UPI0018C47F24|nr:PEP-CTERM sorting domain-containing protein [Nostoc sp. WHI]